MELHHCESMDSEGEEKKDCGIEAIRRDWKYTQHRLNSKYARPFNRRVKFLGLVRENYAAVLKLIGSQRNDSGKRTRMHPELLTVKFVTKQFKQNKQGCSNTITLSTL